MLNSIAALLVCQLIGEITARATGWPLPGPVIGLSVLFFALLILPARGRISPESIASTEIGRTADRLLGILGILFVPAGVGVSQYLGLLGEHGLALAAALVGSTIASLVVTVWVFIWIARRTDSGGGTP